MQKIKLQSSFIMGRPKASGSEAAVTAAKFGRNWNSATAPAIKRALIMMFSIALVMVFSTFLLPKNSNAKDTVAPNFSLKVLNPNSSGYKNISLNALKGKVVIVNFWATWCPPCRAEIPNLVSFYNKNKSKNFVIVGVNVNVTKGGVRQFIHQYKINYPVVYATSKVLSEYGGISEIPQTFFVSKNGIIALHWTGLLPKYALAIASKHLLNKAKG